MKKQDVKEIKNEKIPSYDACDCCGKGLFSEYPVWIHYREKANDLICFKAVCSNCHKIKFYGEAGTNRSGFFYQRTGNSNCLDFDMENWAVVKKLNINAGELKNLLLKNPLRNSFFPEELPKNKIEERPQFYEPISEAEEIKPEEIPF